MSLTLNQFLFLVITVAAVVAATFLITLFVQFRKTAKEGEKTLVELRKLINNLKETEQKVNAKIDDLGDVFKATKKNSNKHIRNNVVFSFKGHQALLQILAYSFSYSTSWLATIEKTKGG